MYFLAIDENLFIHYAIILTRTNQTCVRVCGFFAGMLFIYRSIYLSNRSIYLSAYLSIYISIYLSINQSTY